MNEIALSNNLSQIELEINHHKQIAGQSIWEIGRRLNHVKEHDLAHGQFMSWYQKMGMNPTFVKKAMKVAKEFPNWATLPNLSDNALYLIATLPADEQVEQLNRIEQGEVPTVAELRHLKGKLSAAKQRIAELEEQSQQVRVKEVIKEVGVLPADYHEAISLNQQLMDSNKAHVDRNAFLEQQLQQVAEQREKAGQLDDIERAIEQGRGYLTEQQKEIASTKETIAFLKKGNQFLTSFGGVSYLDIQTVLPKNAQLRMELETFASQLKILYDDVQGLLGQTQDEILEGELL
ncbi:TPA: DUF3102 domain-containing protein [Streptococcus suis]|uniref:DUF3102 domain-containing protein n=1 Tax=Streptococcus suis TaxID=1307 RepID=UPI000CF5374C|nr:DUF3102 domain-containing protein [Streptococcus suis]HEL1703521.1 DUF3102 domain-containing protein [Streptococcus suis]HEM2753110.1 DUF3102 domain-containing protein [Streptococcus suis]